MKTIFATGNKHKFHEVQKVLKEFDIEIEQVPCDYPEDHSQTVQEIAAAGAKHCAEELNLPVFVDDTGIFFAAHDNYPGNAPKKVFDIEGYNGLLKSLEGKERDAFFLCVVAYCEPGQEPMIFEGRLNGTITDEVYDKDVDVMPYERIFMPEGNDFTLSKMTREEKNEISHRAIAVKKLGEYLNDSRPRNISK